MSLSHNWELERSLLGGLLLDSSQYGSTTELVCADDFSKPAHAELFRLLGELAERGGSPDLVVVLDELERRGNPEAYGGVAYVCALPQACATVDHLDDYANRVREHAMRRRLHLAGLGIVEDVADGALDLPALMDGAERRVFEVTAQGGARTWSPMSALVEERMGSIEARVANPADVTGVTTGFVDLDRMLAGLQPTDLVILAARPAMGKTAFALNLALAAAQKAGKAVGVFSLEMGREQLTERLLCSLARVDSQLVRRGRLNPHDDWARLQGAADTLYSLPLHIDDTPSLTVTSLRSKARSLARLCPNLGLLVVDYLQLMQGTGGLKESRENAISAISRGLKILAKELRVPVVALSQLNRNLEARADKRPMPSDLRESGAIEQDADVILFLYRDEVYSPESPDKGIAEVICAKQRNGPTGTVKLAFLSQYTLFANLASAPAGGEEGYY